MKDIEIKNTRICKVCGESFDLLKDIHYISRDCTIKGGFAALSGISEPTIYDTFDCPHCGCQNVIQERKRNYLPENVFAEYDEDDEELTDFDKESDEENKEEDS